MEENGLLVLNGRSPGDESGRFTFANNNGASVIDYVWVDIPHIDFVWDFEVLYDVTPSDHFPIRLDIDIPPSVTPGLVTPETQQSEPVRSLKWKQDKALEYSTGMF